eukprot:TRINITY_DN20068_c0_g1_i1.p1 TRINITY_DN20068_c0_g1~~TRINITY_DN20068_c0_g1_i1.p1  ORF type:complete len:173 (-),score=15.55 TRINITY_DN20068_c0_g1_i1:123-641(-)
MGCSTNKGLAEPPSPKVSQAVSETLRHAAPADPRAEISARGAVDASDIFPVFVEQRSKNEVLTAIGVPNTGEGLILPDASVSSGASGYSSNGDSEERRVTQSKHEQCLDKFINSMHADPAAIKDDIKNRRQRDRYRAQLASTEVSSGLQIEQFIAPGGRDDASDSCSSSISQ